MLTTSCNDRVKAFVIIWTSRSVPKIHSADHVINTQEWHWLNNEKLPLESINFSKASYIGHNLGNGTRRKGIWRYWYVKKAYEGTIMVIHKNTGCHRKSQEIGYNYFMRCCQPQPNNFCANYASKGNSDILCNVIVWNNYVSENYLRPMVTITCSFS